MRVVLHQPPGLLSYDVFVLQDGTGAGMHAWVYDPEHGARFHIEPVEQGEQPVPFLRNVPFDVLGMIVQAFNEGGHATEPGMATHLRDAREVRDRLLTMVERIAQ
jgi:hypothetical protein